MSTIFADAQAKPHLFRWNGPIMPAELEAWSLQRGWNVPPDLGALWVRTGGGTIFETETLLRPTVEGDEESGAAHVTEWLRGQGMASGLFVFHEGLCYTAVRSEDGAYLTLDEYTRVTGVYRSFDTWYVRVLRAEYAERYGLEASITK